jgi:hypothetical protein
MSLGPHGGAPRRLDRIVAGAGAQQPTQIGLFAGEQAIANLAVGR